MREQCLELEMNELTDSYKIFDKSSLILSITYTIGHVLIAMTVISVMTDSSFWESGLVALVEPCINGIWFYVLHRLWKGTKK